MKWILARFAVVLAVTAAVVLLLPGPSASAQGLPAGLHVRAVAKIPALTSTCGVVSLGQFSGNGANFTIWGDTCNDGAWCEAHDVSLPGAADKVGVFVVFAGEDSTGAIQKKSFAELLPMQEGEDFVTHELVGYSLYQCTAYFPSVPFSAQHVPASIQAGVVAKTPALTSTCGIIKLNQWFWNPENLGSVLITKWLNTCNDGAWCEADDISLPGAVVHHGMDIQLGGYDSTGALRKQSTAGIIPIQEGEIFETPTLVGYSSYVCAAYLADTLITP